MNKFILICLFLAVNALKEPTPLDFDKETSVISLECNTYGYFVVNVPTYCKDVNIKVRTVEGQPDLYVSRHIKNPTLHDLTWTSYEWGDEDFTISHWDPEFEPGPLYIGILGYCGSDVATKDEKSKFTLKITLIDSSDRDSDISNKVLDPTILGGNSTHKYHFCVEKCSNITVSLTTDNSAVTPVGLLSHYTREATEEDYVYSLDTKLKDNNLLTIPANEKGQRIGHYYLVVKDKCSDTTSCTLSNSAKFTLKVTVTEVAEDLCNNQITYPPMFNEDKDYLDVEENIDYQISDLKCGHYKYFRFSPTQACKNVRVIVDDLTNINKLIISNLYSPYPHYNMKGWYLNRKDGEISMTRLINSYDRVYRTSNYCGYDENEPCVYYGAVRADCEGEEERGRFKLTLKYEDETNNILNVNPPEDIVSANGYKYYQFCVQDNTDNIRVEINTYLDAEECPSYYSWPELLVSRSLQKPTIYDYTYKLAQIEIRYIDIFTNSSLFRPGHYYVGVFGWCTPADHCDDICTCAPCENVERSPYQVSATSYTNKIPTKPPIEECKSSNFTCPITKAAVEVSVKVALFLTIFAVFLLM